MRTALVVLSIAVGVFSIGVITGAYEIISNDMGVSYAANNPANIEMRMTNFDDDVLSSIRNFQGVQNVEGRRVINYRVHPENSAQWSTIDLIAVEDFSENEVNLLVPISGKAQAGKDEIVLNKKNVDKVHATVGDYLVFELADGTTKKLKVVGIVQDASTGADDFLAPPHGCAL